MDLEKDIKIVKEQIEDLKNRFPAHSIKGHMIAELEELEDILAGLIVKLNIRQGEKNES